MIQEIRDLRLTEEELVALRQQGFVSVEQRGESQYFKLRFRLGGVQRVRYLGSTSETAERIRAELTSLQQERRRDRVIARLTRDAIKLLRSTKRELEPLLRVWGILFHGFSPRRIRARVVADTEVRDDAHDEANQESSSHRRASPSSWAASLTAISRETPK